jgi:hypothetical protein
VAAITHVFTLARVAAMLGEDEDRLHEIAIDMEPEDGLIHVYGLDDDALVAFTNAGIENLRDLLRIHTEIDAQKQAAITVNPTGRS